MIEKSNTKTWIAIPEYQDEIPFVNEAPIDQAESKKQKKQKDGQTKKAAEGAYYLDIALLHFFILLNVSNSVEIINVKNIIIGHGSGIYTTFW